MTVNGTCHTTWDDVVLHICGKRADHGSWHVCPCGASLYVNNGPTPPAPAPIIEPEHDDGEGLRYTLHASQRRCEMNIRHSEVRRALTEPELSYPADKRTPGGICYQTGRIVVITSADGRIVTMLWHGAEGRDEDGQALAAEGQ